MTTHPCLDRDLESTVDIQLNVFDSGPGEQQRLTEIRNQVGTAWNESDGISLRLETSLFRPWC